MNWQHFGSLPVALGALTIAAALFALHFLRVRHRRETVVTTLFWRQAIEEARARTLFERFRHPLAYLLLLALALSIWLAAAGPRPPARVERERVLLLDASAPMGRGQRFALARKALAGALARAPREATRVLWCGAQVEGLYLPGEDPLLLDLRLEGRQPEATPPSIERVIAHLAALPRSRPLEIRLFGDAPLRAEFLKGLPKDVEVARAPLDGEAPEPSGLFTLGVNSAASGAWDRVDLLVRAHSGETPTVELGGGLLTGTPRGKGLLFTDLPAAGGIVHVKAGGSESECVLPERPLLGVLVGGDLPAALLDCLAADPGVRLVEDASKADLCVRRRGDSVGEGLPALELVPASDQQQAFLLTAPGEEPADELLDQALALGLDRIDATSLAGQGGVVIGLGARRGPLRSFSLWSELCGPGYDLIQGRAFPLLIGRVLRWLAGVRRFPAVVAAGEPVALDLTELEPVGLDPVPPRAGRYRRAPDAGGGEVAAALLLPPFEDGAPIAPAGGGGGGDWIGRLTLLALLLALIEGWLLRTGRMP